MWTVRPIWHRNQPVESIQILRWNVFRFHFRVRLLGDRNSYMYYGGIIVANQINWQIAEFKPGKRKIGSLAMSTWPCEERWWDFGDSFADRQQQMPTRLTSSREQFIKLGGGRIVEERSELSRATVVKTVSDCLTTVAPTGRKTD